MSKLIMQLDAPRSTTHSNGFTAIFTGTGSAAVAGSAEARAANAASPVISLRMSSESPGKAAEEAEDVVILDEGTVGDGVLQPLVVDRERGAQVLRHVVVGAQA